MRIEQWNRDNGDIQKYYVHIVGAPSIAFWKQCALIKIFTGENERAALKNQIADKSQYLFFFSGVDDFLAQILEIKALRSKPKNSNCFDIEQQRNRSE